MTAASAPAAPSVPPARPPVAAAGMEARPSALGAARSGALTLSGRLAGLRLPPPIALALNRTRRTLRGAGSTVSTSWQLAQDQRIPRLLLILLVATVMLGVWLYTIERPAGENAQIVSLEDGLWWAIVTMTTTGYGDLVPKTTVGRVAASLTMLAGLTLTSVFTASFASLLVARQLQAARGLEALDLRDHTIICGWNDRAEAVIAGLISATLNRRPQIVLVNELPEERLLELKYKYRKINLRFVRGDPTNEQTLERSGGRNAASVIVLADSVTAPGGEDLRTTVVVLTVEKMNPDVKTTAEVLDPASEQDVRRVEVDDVVVGGQDTGFFLSAGAVAPGLGIAARELLRTGGEAEMRRVDFPRALRGRTYQEAFAWYREQGALLVGVITERTTITLDDVLGAGTDWVSDFIKRMLADASDTVLGQDRDKLRVLFDAPPDFVLGRNDAGLVISGSMTLT